MKDQFACARDIQHFTNKNKFYLTATPKSGLYLHSNNQNSRNDQFKVQSG